MKKEFNVLLSWHIDVNKYVKVEAEDEDEVYDIIFENTDEYIDIDKGEDLNNPDKLSEKQFTWKDFDSAAAYLEPNCFEIV